MNSSIEQAACDYRGSDEEILAEFFDNEQRQASREAFAQAISAIWSEMIANPTTDCEQAHNRALHSALEAILPLQGI